jgi:integrase
VGPDRTDLAKIGKRSWQSKFTLSLLRLRNRSLKVKQVAKNLFITANGVFYAIVTVSGRTIKRSLRTTIRREADASLRKLRGELRGSSAPRQFPSSPAPDAIDAPGFLKAVEEHAASVAFGSTATLRNFKLQKKRLVERCSNWEEFHPAVFWNSFSNKKSSANQFAWYLRAFVEFCTDDDRRWLGKSILKEVKRIRTYHINPRHVRPPSIETVGEFLHMCSRDDAEIGRGIRGIAFTGLRLGGLLSLQWRQVDLKHQRYQCLMKGGKIATIPLIPQAIELLHELKKEPIRRASQSRGGIAEDAIFPFGSTRIARMRRILRKFAKGFEIDLEFPHALRHYFASRALMAGFSPAEVAKMLGHNDGGQLVLRTYGHLDDAILRQKAETLRLAC